MSCMGSTRDIELAKATFQYMMTEARDQDVYYFFGGLQANIFTRRYLAEAFKENYDKLYKRLEGNYSMQILVKMSFDQLSSEKDYEDTAAFFKDKDTSKYDMALKQTLDAIASRAAWIKRSTADIQQWFEAKAAKL